MAWQVDHDPSWPVFSACTRASTSGPRTSPTTRRSGRNRSAVRTSCSREIGAGPSGVGGRASSRTRWSAAGRSSTVSSMVTMRSPRRAAPERGVEQRGLAGRCRPAHDDVAAGGDEQLEHGDERIRSERVEPERAVAEAAHRQAGAVGRHRRDHGAHPGAVGEAGVDDRVGAVEAASERGQDALGDDREFAPVRGGPPGTCGRRARPRRRRGRSRAPRRRRGRRAAGRARRARRAGRRRRAPGARRPERRRAARRARRWARTTQSGSPRSATAARQSSSTRCSSSGARLMPRPPQLAGEQPRDRARAAARRRRLAGSTGRG